MKYLGYLLLLCLLPIQVLAGEGRANLFIYHRFNEPRYASTNIDLETFREHLEVLKKKGARVVRLGEVVHRLLQGGLGNETFVSLTVDDGFRSFLRAFELLRQYGYPVTLFVNTDAVGGASYLSWEELATLHGQGVEIGGHTASHPHMVNRRDGETREAWLERLKTDLRRSREAFRQHLGFVPDLFAYPYGEYDFDVQSLVRQFGFRAAVAQQSGVVHDASDLFALPRFPMGGPYASVASFREKLAMRPLKVLSARPASPVLSGENPPVLELVVDAGNLIAEQLTCYVSGQGRGVVEWLDRAEGRLRITAREPLRGRRGKYTLTAPGRAGGWHWYSHLWIRPEIDESGY
ncbi:MAG: hypothetical protein D6751_08040 [Deltaproteobacteria bacterium]|nr:MAG: hypothetical protein D6751_08040 [Deltaproteobacteria bacterium]